MPSSCALASSETPHIITAQHSFRISCPHTGYRCAESTANHTPPRLSCTQKNQRGNLHSKNTIACPMRVPHSRFLRVAAVFLLAAAPPSLFAQTNSRQIPAAAPGQQRFASGALVGRVFQAVPTASGNAEAVGLSGVSVEAIASSGKTYSATTTGEGIFRMRGLAPGDYQISAALPGFKAFQQSGVKVRAGEVLTIEITLFGSQPPAPAAEPAPGQPETSNQEGSYRELQRHPEQETPQPPAEDLPPQSKTSVPRPDRWNLPLPGWERYDREGDYPNVLGHWYDPFNINRYKGDKPIFGQRTFFNFTGTSVSALDVRRLYIPSGVSAAHPESSVFFGNGRQVFLAETVRLSFELFHGDTSFRPTDWRIRLTPAFNLNQIWTAERGIVNIDVRKGTDRTDAHIGLQEAFVEKKLADLSPNYDFISVRAGIQQFNSDFRGFIFANEEPGFRIFGNLRSNRIEYNGAYFYMLEKDTNSGLNTFSSRDQHVVIGNVYIQDFFKKGYTAQFSYHYNEDDPSVHYDDNGFLVRPADIGVVKPHQINAHYIGWTGNGHVGRFNVSHAAYQVLGQDSLNNIAGRRTDINAQMAALELSQDRDWIRFRGAFFFASGDDNPRDHVARGFDSITEAQTFAGGIFSFFNREEIPLTGTKVPLTAPESFLPDLRASKIEGQSNYVNPGVFIFNVGADFEIPPKLRGVLNASYLRFHHAEVLRQVLFQAPIDSSLGFDYGLGVVYRPPLSENVVITGGVAALTPGTGLQQIFTSRTLLSAFTTVKFQF